MILFALIGFIGLMAAMLGLSFVVARQAQSKYKPPPQGRD